MTIGLLRGISRCSPFLHIPGKPPAMARILRLALLLAIPFYFAPYAGTTVQAEGIGAFFTRVNTYIFAKGPKAGPATLVRARSSFTVLDLVRGNDDVVWYQIVYQPKTVRVKALGWTPMAPHELVGDNQESVLVYSRIPENGKTRFSVFRVPISGLKLLNESQSSKSYPQLDWQKVEYRLRRPLRAWVRGKTGIYRAGKGESFLSRGYGEMVAGNLKREDRQRLLSGIVRIGDTSEEVTWALGDPLQHQNETVASTKRTTWQYPELTVVFENDVVKSFE